MPYRHAYLWILALVPLIGLAFWPSYLGRLGAVSWVLHAHGITAALWVVLTAVQSWSIERSARPLHRAAGRISLGLFPVFWVSGLLIVQVMAAGFVSHDNIFHQTFGARLTPVDIATSVVVLFLYYVAVSRRRVVQVHAAAMLAIPLFLLPPIFVRVFQIAGPLAIRGPDQFYKFGYGLQLSNLISIALAMTLYLRRRKTAWPFLVAAGAIAVQSVLFETLGKSGAWEAAMPGVGAITTGAIIGFGLAISGVVVWLAWTSAPDRPQRAAMAGAPG
ncbi:MAG: hypothetical protein JWL96_350 [Sphingomonas bacterium]|uniref:hypothetical protein n=1 Tax=Sphingomonas bacterium TaxID=1895847 RepID=UPI002635DD3B|nr:hypothetical protein [Sphingomonas bacterium]MDB5708280.1 hypothetical protein [Sphingomonas bacterium]